MNELKNCHDCDAKPGEIHLDCCDVERCSVCGDQLMCCGCDEHDKYFARWTGITPGVAECQYLGMNLNEFYECGLYEIFVKKAVETRDWCILIIDGKITKIELNDVEDVQNSITQLKNYICRKTG